jgi:hypothetical protein
MPTTATLLNRRHESMLPAAVVTGRSVLDIGCALAATGKWVLDRDAKSYTGVELQQDYVDLAVELLSDYPQANIVKQGGLEYFAGSDARYDIVALIGVLHGQYDPLAFLKSAAAAADQYVCIETFGHDRDGVTMMPVRTSRMPVAGQQAESYGFGWKMSPFCLATVMQHLGFKFDSSPDYLLDGQYARYTMRFKRVGAQAAAAADFANIKQFQDEPAHAVQPV